MDKNVLDSSKVIYSHIYNHIRKLKIKKNDDIVVHADLSSMGINNDKLPKIVLTALKRAIGKKGSLIMPSYSMNLSKNYIYNKKKIIQNSTVGILTKEFFKEKNITRSSAPIHSHIGIGKNVGFLKNTPNNISFGKKSDFFNMHKKNFKLILLGCSPQQGATYLHHLESLVGVPYRKWIKLEKKIIYKKKIKKILVDYYARKNNFFVANFNFVFNKIGKMGAKINYAHLKFGYSLSISLFELHKFAFLLLKRKPYVFVKRLMNE